MKDEKSNPLSGDIKTEGKGIPAVEVTQKVDSAAGEEAEIHKDEERNSPDFKRDMEIKGNKRLKLSPVEMANDPKNNLKTHEMDNLNAKHNIILKIDNGIKQLHSFNKEDVSGRVESKVFEGNELIEQAKRKREKLLNNEISIKGTENNKKSQLNNIGEVNTMKGVNEEVQGNLNIENTKREESHANDARKNYENSGWNRRKSTDSRYNNRNDDSGYYRSRENSGNSRWHTERGIYSGYNRDQRHRNNEYEDSRFSRNDNSTGQRWRSNDNRTYETSSNYRRDERSPRSRRIEINKHLQPEFNRGNNGPDTNQRRQFRESHNSGNTDKGYNRDGSRPGDYHEEAGKRRVLGESRKTPERLHDQKVIPRNYNHSYNYRYNVSGTNNYSSGYKESENHRKDYYSRSPKRYYGDREERRSNYPQKDHARDSSPDYRRESYKRGCPEYLKRKSEIDPRDNSPDYRSKIYKRDCPEYLKSKFVDPKEEIRRREEAEKIEQDRIKKEKEKIVSDRVIRELLKYKKECQERLQEEAKKTAVDETILRVSTVKTPDLTKSNARHIKNNTKELKPERVKEKKPVHEKYNENYRSSIGKKRRIIKEDHFNAESQYNNERDIIPVELSAGESVNFYESQTMKDCRIQFDASENKVFTVETNQNQVSTRNELNTVIQDVTTEFDDSINGNFKPIFRICNLKTPLSLYEKPAIAIKTSKIHGKGIFAEEIISPDQIIGEYVGEMISKSLSDEREQRYKCHGMESIYMFGVSKNFVLDATKFGSNLRFMNHSCQPNCYAEIKVFNSSIRRVFFAAERLIRPGEELTIDYQFKRVDGEERVPCLCNSDRCRLFIDK